MIPFKSLNSVLDKRFPVALVAALLIAAASVPTAAKVPEPVRVVVPPAPAAGPADLDLAPSEAYDGKLFAAAYASDVLATALIRPSFQSTYATGIRKSRDGYRVFYMRQWPVMRTFFRHPEAREMKVCDVAIDDQLAQRILDVWKRMLLRVRPQQDWLGMDGTVYDFAMRSSSGELRGEAWNPKPNWRAGRLVTIADAMANYCLASEAWFVPGVETAMWHRLDRRVTELKSRLPK